MNEQWNEALNEISDKHIVEAAGPRPRHWPYWVSAVAAVLALAIGWSILWPGVGHAPEDTKPAVMNSQPTAPTVTSPFETEPTSPTVTSPIVTEPTAPTVTGPQIVLLNQQLARPVYPKLSKAPVRSDYEDYFAYWEAYSAFSQEMQEQYDQPEGYEDSLNDFFYESIREFLSGEGNQAYSPVNVYLALAMLAQTSGGESRQQILDLLGADSIESLQTQAENVWNAHFCDDGITKLLLANSVWLDGEHSFNMDTVQTLADSYYASVFSGDLGSEEMNQLLRQWINEQTGDLLTDKTQELSLDPNSVFALASTIYFKANWWIPFGEKRTANAVFHAPEGDVTVPFMNSELSTEYYWGQDFSAVRLPMEGRNAMWLILPDEGKSVQDVLSSDAYLTMTRDQYGWEQRTDKKVNLSLPKFNISSKTDLIPGIKKLGVTDVFDWRTADMTPMTDTAALRVGKIEHAVRVVIDEEGMLGAAHTIIDVTENGYPKEEEEVDFVLDRPFLFVVTSHDDLPLFTGVVSQP